MGCGASADPKIAVADNNSNSNNKSNGKVANNQNRNGFRQVELKSNNNNYNNYGNNQSVIPEPTKPPLAFVISFDENNKRGNVNRPPPGRLQLEPLKHNPKMTQQQLEDKMRAAELKREQILADRAKSSSVKKRPSSNKNGDARYDSDSYSKNNGYGGSDREYNSREGGDRRERLLNKMRIVPNENNGNYDDSEVEHDPNYRNSNRNARRYS